MITLTSGGFQYPNGTAISGTLNLTLSQDAVASTGQVAPVNIALVVTTGNLSGSDTIWSNSELTPAGTYYTAEVMDSNGARVWGPQLWNLTGSGTTVSVTGIAASPVSTVASNVILLFSVYFPTLLTSNTQEIFRMKFPHKVIYAANYGNSNFISGVASTASKVFAITKNGVAAGTATMGVSAILGSFSAAAVTYEEGDIIVITGPATPDATLAAFSFTFTGARYS